MADATTKFLDLFEDEDAWDRIVRAVPIFKPHTTKDREGKEFTVDVNRLKRIAKRINHLEEFDGVVIRLTPEHTKLVTGPDGRTRLAPQEQQPAPVGYARNARVGPWGPKGEPALLVDFYIAKGRLAEVKDCRYRSPEFFGPEDEIRAVTLLKTEPRLDMGMVTYQRPDFSVYQRLGDWTFYAMEGGTMPDPTKAPDAAAGDDEFAKKCHGAIEQYMSTKYPHLGKMHEAYAAAEAQKQPPEHDFATAEPESPGGENKDIRESAYAYPGGSNKEGQLRAMKAKDDDPHGDYHPRNQPDERGREKKYGRPQLPEAYVKVFESQNQRLAQLEKQLRTERYTAALAPLCEQYGLTLADELADVADYSQERFDKHLTRLKTRFEAYEARALTSGGMVDTTHPLPGNPNPRGNGNAADIIGTQQQLERAELYMREYHGCPFDEAWAFGCSTVKTPFEFRRVRLNGAAK